MERHRWYGDDDLSLPPAGVGCFQDAGRSEGEDESRKSRFSVRLVRFRLISGFFLDGRACSGRN